MIISIIAGVVNILSPESGSIKKNISFAVSLCVVAALFIPLKGVVCDLPKLLRNYNSEEVTGKPDYTASDNLIIQAASDKIKETVSKAIVSKFGLKNFDVDIELDTSDIENIKINKIIVSLKNKNKYMISDIKNYVHSFMQCNVEVKSSD